MSRLLILIWQHQRIYNATDFFYILIQGLRFDLILISLLTLLPAIATPILSKFYRSKKIWNNILRLYLIIIFSFILFTELSTPSFISQFDLRPNYLYVEYLKYPKEIFSTLLASYKLQLLISLLITFYISFSLYKKLLKNKITTKNITFFNIIINFFIIILLYTFLIRSTFDHRPANPSSVAFSSDPLVNMLPLSSLYSVLYSIYETRHEDTGKHPYGELQADIAINIVKQAMHVNKTDFINEKIPTLHTQRAYIQRKKSLNLVIILEESLGADYVGALGGKEITPELDKLANQGIWFENLYATGTRSVRGIEAVITGFTPTPSRSIVKLNKSQTNFFTIAELLSNQGYKTSFIYGGESHFDNMKRFFANNGFDKIIDENDYENPIFYGSWGASDEDLFNKAHQQFLKYPKDQAFFSLVFTSSNHPPFQFPDDKITIEGNKNTINNAVKYADYALGNFIKKAKKSNYWDNTLFLIVADHSDQVYGSEIVPIRRFQIPALILGKTIPPIRYKQVSSQIDLLPTALSLMGINSTHPAIGHDLAKHILTSDTSFQGRAIMQFASSQAYMEGSHVAILQKDKPVIEYDYIDKKLLQRDRIDTLFQQKASAHAVWAINAYRNSEYSLGKYHNPQQNFSIYFTSDQN